MTQVESEQALFERYTYGSLIIFLAVALTTALSTQSSLFAVLFGFAPTLLTIIASFFIFEEEGHGRYYAWALPFVLIPAFYAVWTADIELAAGLSVPDLLGVNLFLSIIYLVTYFLITPSALDDTTRDTSHVHEEREDDVEDAPDHTHDPRVPEDNYNKAVLIGEKCKSLNYAMGQVYDRSAGAVKEARDKIHINREAYNGLVEYYEQREEGGDADITRERAIEHLNTIIDGVNRLSDTEDDVFGELHKAFHDLDRAGDGSDTVIDVLAANSRSPVYAAKKTLMSTCKAVKDDLKA